MKTYDIFRRYTDRAIHVFGIFAALSLVHVQVNAQPGPIPMPQRLDRFHVFADGNIVSAKYMDGYEGYGTRINLARGANGAATTGGVTLSKPLAINTKNGLVVAEAVQKLSARQIAKGFRAAAGGPLGLTLLAAPAVISWLAQSGIEHDDGVFKAPPPLPVGYDGYEYLEQASPPPYHETKALACASYASRMGRVCHNPHSDTTNSGLRFWFQTRNAGAGVVGIQDHYYTRRVDPTPPDTTPVPIPEGELEDRLTAANPTPEVLKEVADKGGVNPDPDAADKPKVQNPVQSQDKTSTKTNPDGSTETTVCRTSGTQVGDTVKLTEQCTITKRDPSGTVTDTTTTNTDESPQAGSDDGFLCTLFPKIVACAELDTPTEEIPKKTETVEFDAEDIGFGPGQCPAPFAWNDSLGQHELDLTAYCNALENYIQPIVVLMAAFAAFMIVAGGINRE